MIRWAARLLVRMGAALLVLSVIVRPAIKTPHGMMGDNLAIIACALMIIIALLYLRFGPADDTPDDINDTNDDSGPAPLRRSTPLKRSAKSRARLAHPRSN